MENYFMKKLITLLTVLLFAMALISCSKVGTSPQGEETPIEKAAIKLVSDVKDGGYKLIGADELYRWME
jgi:hypothetical protein